MHFPLFYSERAICMYECESFGINFFFSSTVRNTSAGTLGLSRHSFEMRTCWSPVPSSNTLKHNFPTSLLSLYAKLPRARRSGCIMLSQTMLTTQLLFSQCLWHNCDFFSRVTHLWFFWPANFKRCFREMYQAIFFQTFSKGQAHHQLYPTKIEIRLRWGYRTNLQKTSKTQFFQKISKPTILKSIKSW